VALVAVVGDCTTTTALALASAWPRHRDVVILEADRTGGSLASWLGCPATPSLTTIVAARPSDRDTTSRWPQWSDVVGAVQNSPSGVRFVAAPVRAREAAIATAEADRSLIPMLAGLESPTIIADLGRHVGCDPLPVVARAAAIVIVVHRQDPGSPGSAAVRLERLVEVVEQLAAGTAAVVLGIVGDQPFDAGEIAELVESDTSTPIALAHHIALDPLSALVLAGRHGVSRRRLARLPLARSIAALVDQLLLIGQGVENAASDDPVEAGESVLVEELVMERDR
jgi:MinD-like ATPase involved in chromosome partitioning or flagellar assembly